MISDLYMSMVRRRDSNKSLNYSLCLKILFINKLHTSKNTLKIQKEYLFPRTLIPFYRVIPMFKY